MNITDTLRSRLQERRKEDRLFGLLFFFVFLTGLLLIIARTFKAANQLERSAHMGKITKERLYERAPLVTDFTEEEKALYDKILLTLLPMEGGLLTKVDLAQDLVLFRRKLSSKK